MYIDCGYPRLKKQRVSEVRRSRPQDNGKERFNINERQLQVTVRLFHDLDVFGTVRHVVEGIV